MKKLEDIVFLGNGDTADFQDERVYINHDSGHSWYFNRPAAVRLAKQILKRYT